MMKRAVCYVALLCAVLCAGCRAPAASPPKAADPLEASGTIQAREIQIASDQGGRVQVVPVAVGDAVGAGAVVVEMDALPWTLELIPAEAAVETARADLAELRAGPRPAEVAAARAAVDLAEAERDAALRAWQNARAAVANPQEIQAQVTDARTQVALAAQGVELAEAKLARERMLRDQQPAGSVERRTADLQVQAAEAALAAAQADELAAQTLLGELLRIQATPLAHIAQAHVARGEYRVAAHRVTEAQAALRDLLAGPTPEADAVAEAAVRQAEAEAAALRVKIARSTLVSPIDGVVVAQAARAGEVVAPAAPILTLADLSEVTLAVFVPEDRIGQVRLGQPVRVTVDSYPDRTFEGHVVHIGDEPEFTPRNVATSEDRRNTFYAVEVQLPNPHGALKPGMPADAAFPTDSPPSPPSPLPPLGEGGSP